MSRSPAGTLSSSGTSGCECPFSVMFTTLQSKGWKPTVHSYILQATASLPTKKIGSLDTLGQPNFPHLEPWQAKLAKITCPMGRQYIENRFQRQSASPGP